MNPFIPTLALTFTLLLPAAAFAQTPSPSEPAATVPTASPADTIDVQHVMDAYHQAVTTHDGARLASLFLPQGSMWLNVLSDEAYARAKAKNPAAVKVRVSSVADFAKLVSTSKASFNPTHTNLQLHSDGTIASVYFDFVFLIDGKEQNRGSETWVLVKESDGWRIADITYSSNPHIS